MWPAPRDLPACSLPLDYAHSGFFSHHTAGIIYLSNNSILIYEYLKACPHVVTGMPRKNVGKITTSKPVQRSFPRWFQILSSWPLRWTITLRLREKILLWHFQKISEVLKWVNSSLPKNSLNNIHENIFCWIIEVVLFFENTSDI